MHPSVYKYVTLPSQTGATACITLLDLPLALLTVHPSPNSDFDYTPVPADVRLSPAWAVALPWAPPAMS